MINSCTNLRRETMLENLNHSEVNISVGELNLEDILVLKCCDSELNKSVVFVY